MSLHGFFNKLKLICTHQLVEQVFQNFSNIFHLYQCWTSSKAKRYARIEKYLSILLKSRILLWEFPLKLSGWDQRMGKVWVFYIIVIERFCQKLTAICEMSHFSFSVKSGISAMALLEKMGGLKRQFWRQRSKESIFSIQLSVSHSWQLSNYTKLETF